MIARILCLFVLTLVVALASASDGAAQLEARQGGETELETARAVLADVTGTWRFAMISQPGAAGMRPATGRRVVTATSTELHLEWSEEFDGSGKRGRGYLGYDPLTHRFFYVALYDDVPAVIALSGSLENGRVAFSPSLADAPFNRPGMLIRSQLHVADADHHTWADPDGQWSVEFTRES